MRDSIHCPNGRKLTGRKGFEVGFPTAVNQCTGVISTATSGDPDHHDCPLPEVTDRGDLRSSRRQHDMSPVASTSATLPAQFRTKRIRFRIFVFAILLTSLAQGKEPKHSQSGTLLQMDSAECGVDENSGQSVVGELVGTDSAHKKTHAVQEYLKQRDSVIYRIRPRDEKHLVLLPVGLVSKMTRCCCKWKMVIARRENTAWFL